MRINLTTRLIIKILMIAGSLLGLHSRASSQSLFSDINVLPPSPNATQFNKFIDQPVNLYTGLPSISVPIFQVRLPQLQLPISLDYHASGLKVGEQSSWVGGGWSLNAGGSINRVVKGLPDEFNTGAKYGFFHLDEVDPNLTMANGRGVAFSEIWECSTTIHVTPPEGPYDLQDFFAQGHYDMEPDLYHFSFPSGGGKFVFSQDRKVVRYHYDDVKIIEHPFEGSIIPDHTGVNTFTWKIQDGTGVVYTFTSQERTHTQSTCGTGVSSFYDAPFWHRSSWQLTKMELQGNWIEFEYEQELSITYDLHLGESRQFKISGSGSQSSASSCNNQTKVEGQRLKRIHTSNGYEILFDTLQSDRLDLPGSKALAGIRIQKDGALVKEYQLEQSYFGSNEKLKLDKVREVGAGEELIHAFDYYPGVFPAKDSREQDYWGYYNGAIQNNGQSSMIPEWRDSVYHVNRNSVVSREPSLSHTIVGALKKHTLPTGGSVLYSYELNQAKVNDDSQWYDNLVTATNEISTGNFYVPNNCYVTIVPDGLPNELTENGVSEIEFRTCTDGTYSNCTEAVLTNVGNRKSLPQGFYQIYARSPDVGTIRSMAVEYEQKFTNPAKPIGGLRIKRIDLQASDAEKSISKVFNYQDENQSSGLLFAKPYLGGYITSYIAGSVIPVGQQGGETCSDDAGGPGYFMNFSASIAVPMSTFQGSHIGYNKVQEYQVLPESIVQFPISVLDQPLGAKSYEFINEKPSKAVYPYVPPEDLSYKNGKPLTEEIYKSVSRDTVVLGQSTQAYALEKVQATTYSYGVVQPVGAKSVLGINFKKTENSYCYSCSLGATEEKYKSNTYEIATKWFKLNSEISSTYLDGNVQSVATSYDYDAVPSYPQVKEITTSGSVGEVLKTEFTRDPLNPELIIKRELFSNALKTKGEELTYFGRLPMVSRRLNLGNSSYELLREVEYDTASRVIQVSNFPNTGSPGIETAYVWGYDGAYPVVTCSNISAADLTTAVSNAITNLPPPHTLNGIDDLDALLDLVFNSGSPNWALWQMFNTELRAALGDRIFKTYTYQDGVGISSATDTNGISQYFEYDVFNRLIRVKDNDQNIVQRHTYHYSNQN